MKNYKLLSAITVIGFLSLLFAWNTSTAQLDACDSTVPYNFVDLTGQPDGIWISPQHSRLGNCCDDEICTSFEVVLDSNAAALSFNLYSGAVSGSMFFQVNCGPPQPVKEIICLSGVGPHEVTFCKPGSNENEYIITSIAKPTFPQDDTTRLGCGKELEVLGFDASTITWTSVFPGAQGDYDYLLSCTDGCATTMFTPTPSSPDYIDYVVCGFPQADECGYVLTLCDTFRVYTVDSLIGSVTPNPGMFCQLGSGSGVALNASATGGNNVYDYTWTDTSGVVVGTGSSYFATSQQTYTLAINDGLYSAYCGAHYIGIPVIETSQPVVDAGSDQLQCPYINDISLIGSVDFAEGAYWSGGSGTFSPDSSYLSCNYSPTASEIASGLLELYLTSTGAGGSCSNVTDTIHISFPEPISIELEDTTLLCNESKVTLTPVVSGGIPPYDYQWSNGYSTSTNYVGEGNYCLAITDDLGCINDTCVNVIVPNLLNLAISSTPTSTDGGSDGDATVVPSGGTAPYQYSWLPGGGITPTITNLSYGIYTITVTDDNGCDREGSVVVNEPRCLGFDASTTFDNLLCHSDATATAIVLAVGGTGPYNYQWNDDLSQKDDTITNLSAGLYSVTTTDNNGCLSITTANIMQPDQLVNTNNITNANTVGGNDGSITANPFGGENPYTYLWDNAETTQTVNGLTTGTYYLTVTDDNGCSITDSSFVNEPICNKFIIYTTATSTTCNGINDGTAYVFIVDGIAPYSILWSTGETTPSIKNLSPDVYSVEVTDAFNCYTFNTITITEPNLLETAIIDNDIRCNGMNNGTADLIVSGGTYPYAYNWSNSNTSEDIMNLGVGLYKVTVTDRNYCATVDSVNISEPTQMITSYIQDNVICYGDLTGAIDVTVSGGILPYSYIWSNGETTQDISDIPAGLYWTEIRDANNCLVSTNFNMHVTEPKPVELDSFFIHCPIPGGTLTIVDFYPIGGTAPYEISVDSGITFLPYGSYSTSLNIAECHYIMINDNNACNSAYFDEIQINSAVVIDSILFDKCYLDTQTESEINVFTSGGTEGLYQISYDNGSTYGNSGEYSGSLLINNEYYIIAMDSANCMSLPDTIIVPDRLVASTSVISNYNGQDISCYGNTDGVALATQTGGEEPYSYLWSNGQTSSSAINLGAGTYSVQITDKNGCITTNSIILTQPNELIQVLTITSDYNGTDVKCYGSEDGSANTTPSGGTTPYAYLWSNDQTDDDAINLGEGTYFVTTTDVNGCIISNSITINQPEAIVLSAIINHVECNAYTDGAIDLEVSGGVAPYEFAWSTGPITEDIDNIGAGTYIVNAKDLNLCAVTKSFDVLEENPIILTPNQQSVSCFGLADASIDIDVSGGVLPYSFSWDNGSLEEDIDGLVAGTYNIVVTDINDCFKNESILITQPDSLWATIQSDFYANGHNVSLYQQSDGSIDIEVYGGITPYTYEWSNEETTEDLSNIEAGNHFVTITDINGCKYSISIELSEPFDLEIPTVITPNGDGKNDYFHVNGLESYPENKLVIFNRWGDMVYEKNKYDHKWDGEDLPAGNYYVVLNINSDEIILTGFVEIIR